MKKIYSILVAMAAMTTALHAEIETTVGASVVSSYIWRGVDMGGCSVQPSLGLSYEGLSLSVWGSTGLTNPLDTKELDLTLSYSLKGFCAGVTDYWFSTGPEPGGRYFRYAEDATNHVFEAFAGYDCGVASLTWYTNIYGNDFAPDGSRAFSSYCELTAPFSAGGADWTAALGLVPFATPFYGTDGLAVTNLSITAAKEIAITDKFGLPLTAGLVFNPASEKAYFVVGLTF